MMVEGGNSTTFLLPGGYVDEDGAVHREGELAPLTGREEELLSQWRGPAGAALVTALLSRCVRRIGVVSPITETLVRQLLVADRQYLLLQVRRATFGHQVQATVRCPWQDCAKKVDIDFSLEDIPVRKSAQQSRLYSMDLSPQAALISDQGEAYRGVTFRLPNGADQERIAPRGVENASQALALLLTRCVHSIGPVADPGPEMIHRLSPLARGEIQRHMEALAPQVDLGMEVNCPDCARAFSVPFDLQAFLLGELKTSRDLLYREVHYLAYYYHWSEQGIMTMPREKRRTYIAVLVEEMERVSHVA